MKKEVYVVTVDQLSGAENLDDTVWKYKVDSVFNNRDDAINYASSLTNYPDFICPSLNDTAVPWTLYRAAKEIGFFEYTRVNDDDYYEDDEVAVDMYASVGEYELK